MRSASSRSWIRPMNLVGAADHLARASRHTELLMIDTRGCGDFPELLSHSVGANFLRRAGCPVVAIPPTAILQERDQAGSRSRNLAWTTPSRIPPTTRHVTTCNKQARANDVTGSTNGPSSATNGRTVTCRLHGSAKSVNYPVQHTPESIPKMTTICPHFRRRQGCHRKPYERSLFAPRNAQE